MAFGSRPLIQLVGASLTSDVLRDWEREAQLAMSAAIYEEAKRELPMTQEIVPYQSGALHDTARVEKFPAEGGIIASGILYGDETVDYAVPVHEDLEAYHPHGQAKYVEEIMRREMENGMAVDMIQITFDEYMRKFENTGRMKTSLGNLRVNSKGVVVPG